VNPASIGGASGTATTRVVIVGVVLTTATTVHVMAIGHVAFDGPCGCAGDRSGASGRAADAATASPDP
jgi:hypothetical protein